MSITGSTSRIYKMLVRIHERVETTLVSSHTVPEAITLLSLTALILIRLGFALYPNRDPKPSSCGGKYVAQTEKSLSFSAMGL